VTEIIPARISVPNSNLRALMIWPAHALADGHYRVVINAGSSSRFSDIAGQSLVLGMPDELGDSVISTFDVEVRP
jgi:hypothetical protein